MMIGMRLISKSGLVEEDGVEVFHYVGFHLYSSFLCKISRPFRKYNNVVEFPFFFPHLHAFGKLVVHPPSRIVSHFNSEKLP